MPPARTAPVSPSRNDGRALENDWQKAGVLMLLLQAEWILVRIILGDLWY